MIPSADEKTLALLYHLNSEPWLNLRAYSTYQGPAEFKSVANGSVPVSLPPAKDSALAGLLRQRRTERQFSVAGLSLQDLASLLQNGYGVLSVRSEAPLLRTYQRPVPSAGGRYPLELYVIALSVNGLDGGSFHYHSAEHRLELVSPAKDLGDITPVMMNQEFIATAGAVIVITAVFSRTLQKYGPRGYRYMLFEAGHVAQNICLHAIELGLGTACIGGFIDSALNACLGLDGTHEAALYGVAVGPV